MPNKNKIITQGEEMPMDFWNYRVNPILGYYVKQKVTSKKWQTK